MALADIFRSSGWIQAGKMYPSVTTPPVQACDTKPAARDIGGLQVFASIGSAESLRLRTLEKEPIMKRSHKVAAGVVAALSLGAAAVVFAHPGPMGDGMGPAMKGGMGHGGMAGGPAGFAAGQQLMTSEERTALQEKMRSAKTPEERQKLAEATHTEMQKRAKEKGVTLPEAHGHGAGFGPRFAPPAAETR